jgi:hypothetical protein
MRGAFNKAKPQMDTDEHRYSGQGLEDDSFPLQTGVFEV